MDGHHDAAIPHFSEAHRLVPESWTFRRQAWSLEKVIDGPLARFWQGPDPAKPEAWPYDGDWLADIRSGAENYSEPVRPVTHGGLVGRTGREQGSVRSSP